MKKNFICTKKSVRTFKLRIEPSFLSHAERGKTFWIREFLAGMRLCRRFAPTPFRLLIPISNFGGVYCTKFECISDKIRRILTNDTCASAALDKLARGKTQKFPIIFICGSPHTPRREAEILKGRKFLVLLPPLHSSKKANKCSLAFLPVLRPPFLRRLRRPEALPSPRSVVVR